MTVHQEQFTVETAGRGTREITPEVAAVVQAAGIRTGICQVFIQHTSASLMICENADPQVRADLETFLSRLAPDGDPDFRHDEEGPDDMPAHVRSILTSTDLGIPVSGGKLVLGTWQGIYLYEHRRAAHRRRISVTVLGE